MGKRLTPPIIEIPGSAYVVAPRSALLPESKKFQKFLEVIRLSDLQEVDLALLVRLCRARLGLDIQDVAEKTEVSRQLIGKIERGEHIPSINIIEKLSSLFGNEFLEFVKERNYLGQ
jgi:ribosome-binding protein aMBF1 (putative translation factor)